MTPVILSAHTPARLRFTQKSEQEEKEFWRLLADTPHIRGLEQPCHENLHAYGDEWLFRHTPGEWQIVVTAIPETMRRRSGGNLAFVWPPAMKNNVGHASSSIVICLTKSMG